MDLNYQDIGQGFPFVFQHGIGASLSQPLSVADTFSLSCRYVSMDCRGHGASLLGPKEELSIANYAEDVLALMDHLAIQQAVVGGISMGAAISLRISLMAPEKVKALVLLRPAWLNIPKPEPLNILRDIAGYIGSYGPYEGKELFKRHPGYMQMEEELPPYARSLLNQFETDQPEFREAVLMHVTDSAPFNAFEALSTIQCPTLIVSSDKDPLHPLSYGEELAAHIAGAQLVEVCSKYIDIDRHTQEVKEAVESFWQQHIQR